MAAFRSRASADAAEIHSTKDGNPQKDAEKSDFQNCFKSGKLNRFASIVSSGYLLILAKMISL